MIKQIITFLFVVLSNFLFSQQVIEFKNGTYSENSSIELQEPVNFSKSTSSLKSAESVTSDEVTYALSYYDSLYFSPNALNGSVKLVKKGKTGAFEEQQLITNYFFSPAVSQLSPGDYYLVFLASEKEYFLKLDILFLEH